MPLPGERPNTTIYVDSRDGKVVFKTGGIGAPFQEGLAIVRRGSHAVAVSPKGKVVCSLSTDSATSFSEGLSAIERNGKSGCVDSRGRLVLPLRFASFEPFSEGLACAGVTNRDKSVSVGYVSRAGAWAIPPRFVRAGPFHQGLAPAVVGLDDKQRLGFLDATGEWAIQPTFAVPGEHTELPAFHEGLARIGVAPAFKDQWNDAEAVQPPIGFIDIRGKYQIPPSYFDAGHFSGGLAPVQVENKAGLERYTWGYVDSRGQLMIPAAYSAARDFVGNVAPVARHGKWQLIDRQGKEVTQQDYRQIQVVNQVSFLAITEDFEQGFLSPDGRFLTTVPLPAEERKPPFGVDVDRRVGYSELQIERELGPADESRDTPLVAAPKIRFEVGYCPICHGNPLKERLPIARHQTTVRVLRFTADSRGRFRHMVWLVQEGDGIWRVFHDETWDEEFEF